MLPKSNFVQRFFAPKKLLNFFRGFSLIELMISLIVVSAITAAFAPVITKKLKTSTVSAGNISNLRTGGVCARLFNEHCKVCNIKESDKKCYVCLSECAYGQLKATEACTCEDCPDGKVCTGGTEPRDPAPGYYSERGKEISCASKIPGCKSCVGENFGTSVTCTTCEKDSYLFNNTCNDCTSEKKFCPEGTTSQTAVSCTSKFGSRCDTCNSTGCTACIAGSYISNGICTECDAGSSCDGVNKTLCPKGHYQSAKGKSSCTPCEAGTYQNLTGKTSCENCAVGYAQSAQGQESCVKCGYGYYQDREKQISCKPCHADLNDNCIDCAYNTGKCIWCSAGSFLVTNSSKNRCNSCPVGGNCSGGSTVTCETGYYKTGTESSQTCRACGTIDTGCTECRSGSGTNGICTKCTAGFYANSSGTKCIACSQEMTACSACTSQSSCTQCTAGYYLSGNSCKTCSGSMTGCKRCSSSSVCTECESNYFLSSNKCKLCSKSSQDNMTGCLTCSSDGYTCYQCEQGYYLNEGKCYPCSSIEGCRFCSGEGVCTDCKEGFKANGNTCVKKIASQADCDNIAAKIGVDNNYLLYINGTCVTKCNIGDSPCGFRLSYSTGTCCSGTKTADSSANKTSNLAETFTYPSSSRTVCDLAGATSACQNLNSLHGISGYTWSIPDENDFGSWGNFTTVRSLHLCDGHTSAVANSNQCTTGTCSGKTCSPYAVMGAGYGSTHIYGGLRNGLWYVSISPENLAGQAQSVRCVLR